jgi:hypothetical protein
LCTTDFAHLKAHRFFEGIDWATLHTTTPPVLTAPAVPVFVDEEKERKFKAQQAKSSVWGKFLFKNSDEVIIQTGKCECRRVSSCACRVVRGC